MGEKNGAKLFRQSGGTRFSLKKTGGREIVPREKNKKADRKNVCSPY